ncbi:MAG: ATP-binding cassette domain-containing protein [Spirochaetales bacterium]|nr:ATP-binding cassette domain-containing protein [Spirochaetales bacterium]
MTQIQISNLNLFYSENLVTGLSAVFRKGWTALGGANGCGKTSLAHCLYSSLTGSPHHDCPAGLRWTGEVIGPESICFLPQYPVFSEEGLLDFFYGPENENRRIASLMELDEGWIWNRDISWGEKRRLQIAAALSSRPEVLILDEPENHLDRRNLDLIGKALKEFEGIGIIIGHNRALMNSLCSSTLLLRGGRGRQYSGSFEKALTLYEEGEAEIRRERSRIKGDLKKEQQKLNSYENFARKTGDNMSKRDLAAKDHDRKAAIDLARITSSGASSRARVTQQKRRMEAERQKLEETRSDTFRKLGLTVLGRVSHRDRLLELPSGRYRIFPDVYLDLPQITVLPRDRIILEGDNGSGKTGLLNLIRKKLPGGIRFGWIPQELSQDEKEKLTARLGELDEMEKGLVLAYFSRMGSDPDQLLQQGEGSPGEYKKLLMALSFLDNLELLILDEPANHLDIFSMQVIEEALKEFPGAVIMVSHEREFTLPGKVWTIKDRTLRTEGIRTPEAPSQR